MVGETEQGAPFVLDTMRGISLWLGAALIGSFASSAALTACLTAGWTGSERWSLLGLSIISLLWTVPTSAVVMLAFAWPGWSGTSVGLRRIMLVPVGALAGPAIMMLGESSVAPLFGCVYGAVVASAWSGLHWALYGRR